MNWQWAMLCGSPAVGKEAEQSKVWKAFFCILPVLADNVRFSLDIRYEL
jgi:hypothetical protein